MIEPQHEISNYVVCVTSKGSDQPAQTCSLIRAFAGHLNIKILRKHHLEFISLKVQAPGSLHMSKCQIVGNHMMGLI